MTVTSPAVTVAGIILGTAAYMAPEQAKGRSADARADIWAFGCVLFEMLAGRAPFAGESVVDILSTVIQGDPDWSALPVHTPAAVRRLLSRCLEKNPKHRLAAIADARLDLDDAARPQPADDARALGDPAPVDATLRPVGHAGCADATAVTCSPDRVVTSCGMYDSLGIESRGEASIHGNDSARDADLPRLPDRPAHGGERRRTGACLRLSGAAIGCARGAPRQPVDRAGAGIVSRRRSTRLRPGGRLPVPDGTRRTGRCRAGARWLDVGVDVVRPAAQSAADPRRRCRPMRRRPEGSSCPPSSRSTGWSHG